MVSEEKKSLEVTGREGRRGLMACVFKSKSRWFRPRRNLPDAARKNSSGTSVAYHLRPVEAPS